MVVIGWHGGSLPVEVELSRRPGSYVRRRRAVCVGLSMSPVTLGGRPYSRLLGSSPGRALDRTGAGPCFAWPCGLAASRREPADRGCRSARGPRLDRGGADRVGTAADAPLQHAD